MLTRKNCLAAVLLICALPGIVWFHTTACAQQTNVIWRTAQGAASYQNDMLLLIDEPSETMYLQLSGPANRWFAWGFGNTVMANTYTIVVSGGTVQERKLGNHTAGTVLTPQVAVLGNCVTNDRRFVFLERALTGLTSSHYSFSTNVDDLKLIWAVGEGMTFAYEARNGAGTASAQRLPAPGFGGITRTNDGAFLQVTNLPVGPTSYLQAGKTLLSNDWSVAASLITRPGCNALMLTFSTNFTYSGTEADRLFFRIMR